MTWVHKNSCLDRSLGTAAGLVISVSSNIAAALDLEIGLEFAAGFENIPGQARYPCSALRDPIGKFNWIRLGTPAL